MLMLRLFSCRQVQTVNRQCLMSSRHCYNRLQVSRQFRSAESGRLHASLNKPWSSREAVRKKLASFRISMTEEEKKLKLNEIERLKTEQKPVGLFAKFKFYVRRYWYIAIPVHTINCAIWFGVLYVTIRSGVDVVKLLEMAHLPDTIMDKIKKTPPSANALVLTFLLYKLAMPIRYAITLVAIRATFVLLRKLGLLRTAREVEFSMRHRYEQLNKRRLSGVINLSNLTARLNSMRRTVKQPPASVKTPSNKLK